jgi:hypothetical protein
MVSVPEETEKKNFQKNYDTDVNGASLTRVDHKNPFKKGASLPTSRN